MKKILKLCVVFFVSMNSYATPATLVGTWIPQSIVDNCYFTDEDVSFSSDGSYMTHLQDRPAETGAWEVKGKVLVLTDADGSVTKISRWTIDKKLLTLFVGKQKCVYKRALEFAA